MVYGVLWLLTVTVGRHQVRQPIIAAVRDTVIRARPSLPAVELKSDSFSGEHAGQKQYYALAFAPVPFLVRIDYGYQIEPLWGSGAEEWYLWLLGAKIRVARPKFWMS